MENRLESEAHERPGAALIALVVILVITAAWWALALWPTGATEPEWLTRTRAACFGSRPGGLPDAGGWLLLIGEPVGMIAVLGAVWGGSLKRSFRWISVRPAWRYTATLAVAGSLIFAMVLGMRVVRAQAAVATTISGNDGVARRVGVRAPSTRLTDQYGQSISLTQFRGEQVLLTFAYGHCAAVCPSIVSDLRVARRKPSSKRFRIVILTLDPWRDTPERLPSLARQWRLESNDLVLSADVARVEKTLDALAIGRKRNETTGDIDHGTVVMVLDGLGQIVWRVDGGTVDFAELMSD